MADYSNNYNPAAPISNMIVSTTAPVQTDGTAIATCEVRMLLDTGADISFIPQEIVKMLETQLGQRLPYDFQIVEDFNGIRFKQKKYKLKIVSASEKVGSGNKMDFLEVKGDEGILGRDVLNDYSICLNGPELTWTNAGGEDEV